VTHKLIRKLKENSIAICALGWILLWLTPWQIWLGSFPWIRLGLGGIIFAVPGTAISLFLMDKRLSLSAHFTSGVAISVVLVGLLGLLGRFFNLPYKYITPVFALTGLIFLLGLISRPHAEHPLYKPGKLSVMSWALLLFMLVFGAMINLQSRFGGDEFSYLAYLTNWQHAQPLNFREVIFGSGNADSIRFWLAMFPMDLAFLAEISNLHGLLLLGLYLEPYLIAIAILATYNLYEDLLEKEHLAIAAVLLHFTFFILLQGIRQPGSSFFVRLSEDKVFAAYVLAPVLFLAMHHFLESFTLRTGIFTFLSGLSLALTHPIILAYGVFIAGLYLGTVTLMKRDYKKLGVGITLLIIMILPSMFLRFIDGPLTTRYAVNLQSALDAYGDFSETRFSYIEGTPFYGFDLERIKIQPIDPNQENPLTALFSWSYLWLVGSGFIWSLFSLRRKFIAPFIGSTSLLVLLCGTPYTGWLVGYFVSAGMLWRSPWLLPIGLIGVVLLAELLRFVLHRVSADGQSSTFGERATLRLTAVICIVLISYFSIYRYEPGSETVPGQNGYQQRLERLAALGDYLESNIEQPSVFVAPFELMNYLPGLSSKAKVVFFRTSAFTPQPVDTEKLGLIFSRDASIPIKQRMSILRDYHIQYILMEDLSLKEYYASYPEFFQIQEIDNFWMIAFQDSSSQ